MRRGRGLLRLLGLLAACSAQVGRSDAGRAAFQGGVVATSSAPPEGRRLAKEPPGRRLAKGWGAEASLDDDAVKDKACTGRAISQARFANATAGSSCAFVDDACDGFGEGLFAYLRLTYCSPLPPSAVVALLCLELLLLISLLATTADAFLVKQLEWLARALRLPPEVAGITLLALGNGAPDLFAAKAALDGGGSADFPLMLSGLLGASIFISTVVLGAVLLASDAAHGPNGWAVEADVFKRDIGVYIFTVVVIYAVAADGHVDAAQALGFLALYAAYITAVVFARRWRPKAVSGDAARLDDVFFPEGVRCPLTGMASLDYARLDYARLEDEAFDEFSEAGLPELLRPPVAMAGLDWGLVSGGNGAAAALAKAQFVFEYPFSLLRHLSIPGTPDDGWDERRRKFAVAAPPCATLLVLLDAPWSDSKSDSNGFKGLDAKVQGVNVCVLAVGCGAVASAAVWLATRAAPPQPRLQACLVVVGFASTIVWLDVISAELVAIIQALGRIFGISTSVLGLTVIAMGNSVGDLVANVATARAISPQMAVSACFGGPLLNDILGVGISTTMYTLANHEPLKSPLNAQDHVAYLFLILSLVGTAVCLPLGGYVAGAPAGVSRTRRLYPLGLFALYGVFMAISCLVEADVIPQRKVCEYAGLGKHCRETST
ncbi:Sodium/calcium exchanger protein-domain-containing protein [Pelagophyceae sp. CCMP2097]|nr:Sodium/calcium exchanger protein-domain-containing protein [Pelagophyceae sp. CCMP2097]|mmetsp:Transcript_19041/g.67664  ORF Transcript_19041/g.67664 Transcript_19041/m.67664 type:complete len:662 (+) Transcript_19041:96-2081(+)